MSFKSINVVEASEFYLGLALSRARKAVKEYLAGLKVKDKDRRAVMAEKLRFRVVKDTLNGSLGRVVSSFPGIDGLSEFYGELLQAHFDVSRLRKALSSVDWATGKVSELATAYSVKVARASSKNEAGIIRDSFIGRVSSILKRIRGHLIVLRDARKVFLSFPVIKDDCFTVCIVGFPNVGKSTLLSKITPANPKIGVYAFTTKNLNIGYFKNKHAKVQVVDCPGTLARFDKMNYIEKQAFLAMKYLADLVVFIFDLVEEYPLEAQFRLLAQVKKVDKPISCYVSKVDIIDNSIVDSFVSGFSEGGLLLTPASLKDFICSFMDKNYS